jgi:predicted component of type VI protein secretion system
LLGFGGAQHAPADPITQVKEDAQTPAQFAVGWLVITAGPGRGKAFTLLDGVSNIGRGADQEVRLDFGDNSISRESHAVIAYDRMSRSFYLGHGGKANLVRLRDTPVLSTEKINDSDTIKIGETELRLVALCGEDFDWESDTSSNDTDLSFG